MNLENKGHIGVKGDRIIISRFPSHNLLDTKVDLDLLRSTSQILMSNIVKFYETNDLFIIGLDDLGNQIIISPIWMGKISTTSQRYNRVVNSIGLQWYESFLNSIQDGLKSHKMPNGYSVITGEDYLYITNRVGSTGKYSIDKDWILDDLHRYLRSNYSFYQYPGDYYVAVSDKIMINLSYSELYINKSVPIPGPFTLISRGQFEDKMGKLIQKIYV